MILICTPLNNELLEPDTRHTSLECFHSSQFASSMTLHNTGNLIQKKFNQSQRNFWHSEPIRGLETGKIWTMPGSETLSRHVLLLPEYTLSLFTEYWIDIASVSTNKAHNWKIETQFVKKLKYLHKKYILARLEACVICRIRIKSVELSDLD